MAARSSLAHRCRVPATRCKLDINGQVVGQGQVDASGRWSIPAPRSPLAQSRARQSGCPRSRGTACPAGTVARALRQRALRGGPTARSWRRRPAAPLRWWVRNLGLDPRYVTAQKSMDIGKEQLAQALRPNSKIADTYRQELMKLVDITGKTWDNPEAMWLDIQTDRQGTAGQVDAVGEHRQRQDRGPIEDRKDALDISNAIRFSLQRLDVPQVKGPTRRRSTTNSRRGTRYLFRNDPKPLTKK